MAGWSGSAGAPGIVGAGSGLVSAERPQRLVEHAIIEIRRALDRVIDVTIRVQENADRHLGAEPIPPTANGKDVPAPTHEGYQLNDSLAQLHARLDTLYEQVTRLNQI